MLESPHTPNNGNSLPPEVSAHDVLGRAAAAILGLAVLLGLTVLSVNLWLKYGLVIYVDSLAGAIWNCF